MGLRNGGYVLGKKPFEESHQTRDEGCHQSYANNVEQAMEHRELQRVVCDVSAYGTD